MSKLFQTESQRSHWTLDAILKQVLERLQNRDLYNWIFRIFENAFLSRKHEKTEEKIFVLISFRVFVINPFSYCTRKLDNGSEY